MYKLSGGTVRFLKKSVSLVLVLTLVLSVCVISGLSLSVSAATASGQGILINLSQNTQWKNVDPITVRYADSSGNTLGSAGSEGKDVSKSADGLFHLNSVPAGATKIGISSASFPLPETVVPNGKRRIVLKATSVNGTKYNNPYVYYYKSDGSYGAAWPGSQMISLGNDYYYYDIDTSYTKAVFSDNGNNQTQTADLTINTSYGAYVSYYTGSGWANPYAKIIDVSSISSRSPTEFYLKSDGTFQESKYLSNITDQKDNSNITFSTVYVINESWNSLGTIYATYDYDDPYRATIALTKTTRNGITAFRGYIPEGARVRFHPSSTSTSSASDYTYYPTGSYDKTGYSDNTATYKITSVIEKWGKFSEINDVAYDAVVPDNFSQYANIIGIDATYFDYLSDNERNYGYLNNYDLGYDNNNWNKGKNTWFPFFNFNDYISNIASQNSSWNYPLYFGNFYKTDNQFGYSDAKNGLTRYYDSDYRYAINNSNGLNNFNQSLQGLAYSKLDSKGDIQAANGVKMPYFDEDALTVATYGGKRVAKVFKSYFPFKTSTDSNDVTTYSFDSENAKDNVYFTWDGTNPKYVNYGSGTGYGVNDGGSYYGGSTGYGVFPFNVNNSLKTQTVIDSVENVTVPQDEFWIKGSYSNIYAYNGASYISPYTSANGYFKFRVSQFSSNATITFYSNTSGSKISSSRFALANLRGQAWSVNTYSRGGNDNLDFGFGVRLDIDFRVPKNGTVNGTTSGQAVTFDFTGDDDLWVYIGEDSSGAGADLVLDLGGDHKQATGSINFKTMEATANDVFVDFANPNKSSVPSNEFWVEVGNGHTEFCVYTWNNSGNKYVTPYKTENGYYKFRSSDFSGYTGAIFCKWKNVNDGKLSSDLQLSNLYGKVFKDNAAETSLGIGGSGPVTKKFNGGVNLDPNTTYHMVVFYMERGLSESNFKTSFTMTPANNDLLVSKTLDTADVVNEIATDLRNKETYKYTINDGTGNQDGKAYKLNGKAATLDADGNFTLKDSHVADFDSTFKTESNMTVKESLTNNALSYETSWELYDDLGQVIKSAKNSTNASFALVNPNDESKDAILNLDYTNKIRTSTLTLNKNVFMEDGKTEFNTTKQFPFRLTLDLDGSGSVYDYKAYPIEYMLDGDIYSVDENGEFTIDKGQEIEFIGLPVGSTYKLEELKTVGFKPYNISLNNATPISFNGTMTGTVGNSNSVTVGNIVHETNSAVTINKTLDGSLYSGSKFNYVLSGLDTMVTQYDDPEHIGKKLSTFKTSGTQTVTKPTNGQVKFDDTNVLSFVETGYYRFKITEKFASSVTTAEQNDYIMDSSTIFVEIQLNDEGEPQKPKFFKVPNEKLAGITKDADYSPFFNSDTYLVASGTTPEFYNTTKHGSAKVTKKNQSDGLLSDTVFGLIKVSEADIIDDTSLQAIITANQHITQAKTNASGEATFSNLVIFKDGTGEFKKNGSSVVWSSTSDNYISGTVAYQTYCLFEYSPKSGYNPSYVKKYFTLPTDGSYNVTFGYVDGAITVPNSSGPGMNIIFVFGFGVACTAVLAAGGLLYDRSRRRRRKLRHTA